MENKEKIELIVVQQGFADYAWIDPRDIIVAHWVRVKCQFGCSDYGLGTCPPNTPSVNDCMHFFNEYKSGLMIRLNQYADKDDYPSGWSRDVTSHLLEVERRLFLSGYYKTFLLNQTCCTLCSDCAGSRLNCNDKKHARPSPESFAVDVYATARNAGLEIHVVADNPSEMNRFAILLIE